MGLAWKLTLIDTFDYEPIYWESLRFISREEYDEFLRANPMPENPFYEDPEELWYDITHAEGAITVPRSAAVSQEFLDWFADLVWTLL